MKSLFLLGCALSSAAAIVTRNLPFIKTLSYPRDMIDYRKPYTYHGVSRCEFSNSTQPSLERFQHLAGPRWECASYYDGRYNHCTVASEVTDMTSLEFAMTTVALCNEYNGFLMIQMSPPDNQQQNTIKFQ
ncbi:hypothetical protein EDD21DRAFT_389866 [Dissophora ornata]|nr:hypothetical protein EDD21DRAFT_389866 [Dissophora ornata]